MHIAAKMFSSFCTCKFCYVIYYTALEGISTYFNFYMYMAFLRQNLFRNKLTIKNYMKQYILGQDFPIKIV